MNRNILNLVLSFYFVLSFAGCSGADIKTHKNSSGTSGIGPYKGGNKRSETASESDGNSPMVGPSCKNGDSNHVCLSLKYVAYKSSNGEEVLDQSGATSIINGINKIWSQCNLGFQIDEFVTPNPVEAGLNYNPAQEFELTDIRNAYRDAGTLLVVTTGAWNRRGSLGNTGANAWTSMPGEPPYGVVLEQPVATFSNIIAHELGHYLGLPHYGDSRDVMNPIIYNNSEDLTDEQCSSARRTAASYWQKMIR